MNAVIIWDFLRSIGWSGFLDIAILSLLLYGVLVWFKTTRAASVLAGILIIAFIYIVVRQLNLAMTAFVFEKFFAVFLVALVVIFQEELRSFFERVAAVGSFRRTSRRRSKPQRQDVNSLARTCGNLAKSKTGALIVLKGKDSLSRHVDGGIFLGGYSSEPIFLSIFDVSSPGHDGAIIMHEGKIERFACHLPLSKNLAEGLGGTRHSAALGLSELCDALCIVVSEERGKISVAQNGVLTTLSGPEELIKILEKFLDEVQPIKKSSPFDLIVKRNFREKVLAILLALGLWFVHVHSSKIIYKTYTIPISHVDTQKPYYIEDMDPKNADVTFHAPRSAFYFFKKQDVQLIVRVESKEFNQFVPIVSENLIYPKDLILDNINPRYVRISVKKKDPA
ncbi:MAG: diadenylate cyclase CdaA [Candidatus Omnitrophica bacterium]|nr:diadenylate cyclase CdaA [Candidatus Omnitrophota bacterium]